MERSQRAANYEPASELKTLVQAHGFTDIKTAVVLTSRESPDTLDKKWAHVNLKGHGPEIKKFPMFHLGSELPAFLTCQASPAALPLSSLSPITIASSQACRWGSTSLQISRGKGNKSFTAVDKVLLRVVDRRYFLRSALIWTPKSRRDRKSVV